MSRVAQAVELLTAVVSRPPVSDIARAFDEAGHQIALVGGPVRDAFLGRPVNDLDFTTSARPDETERILRPIADAVWDVGRQFGTIAAQMGEHTVEITTFRSDTYDGASRKPDVQFGDSLEGDLARRDFTINAMALVVPQVTLVDPSGGLDDLLASRLRTPGRPELSFGDDPLRMLRACRFVAQLGVGITEETWSGLRAMAERITVISAERVRDELVKLLSVDSPRAGVDAFVQSGLAQHVLPELAQLVEERDEHNRHKDVYQHSLTVLDQAIALEKERHPGQPPDLVLRLGALLHDIGKPRTKKFESHGQVTFHHHDVVGAKMAEKRLTALRLDNHSISSVKKLIELHLRFFGYADQSWTDSAVRRYVRDAGEELTRLHIITRADVTTRNVKKAARLQQAYDDLEDRIEELSQKEELAAIRPDLSGDDIMEILGVRPGPEVGKAYRFLLDLRLDEGPLGKEEATRRLVDWWAERPNGLQPPPRGR